MPSVARQFEPQITRTGGAPSKYRFTARCSACHKSDTYEASKPAGDELVKGYFKDRGWLLGRDRAYDLCPACLAKPQDAQQSRGFNRVGHRRSPEAANHTDRLTAPADKRTRETADILARHLGKPETLAAEVFKPKPVQVPRSSVPDAPQQAGSAPALSPEIEQALTGMAAELKILRSTMELIAEQVGQLVALGGQQIEAMARVAPLVVQSAEGISGGLREVAGAIRAIPSSPAKVDETLKPAYEPTTLEEHPAPQLNLLQEMDQAVSPEAEPAPTIVKARKPSKQDQLPKRNQVPALKAATAAVVVKSIADPKRSDRFYTSVRLPRELWDSAGFGSDDRLLLDWSGKALTIERAAERGVKPKSIGDASVVLQSWKLGNLNFDQPKVSSGDASLRLFS